jgi:glycine cleavage system H protein
MSSEVRYTATHEWARKEGGLVVVGVTDYAQSALGDVVYVSEAAVGALVQREAHVVVIDSVKVSAELYAPISGTVEQFNQRLTGSPELVNEDPMGEGWIVKIKPGDPAEFDKLLTLEEYNKVISA